jgi:hypothetical protein
VFGKSFLVLNRHAIAILNVGVLNTLYNNKNIYLQIFRYLRVFAKAKILNFRHAFVVIFIFDRQNWPFRFLLITNLPVVGLSSSLAKLDAIALRSAQLLSHSLECITRASFLFNLITFSCKVCLT